MKFTFKTTKATGRYRAFYSDFHKIKLNIDEILKKHNLHFLGDAK